MDISNGERLSVKRGTGNGEWERELWNGNGKWKQGMGMRILIWLEKSFYTLRIGFLARARQYSSKTSFT